MSSSHQNTPINHAKKELVRLIDAVVERGFDEKTEDCDDYAILLQRHEVRKLVTYQIYNSYFPPGRHEFELQLVSGLVDAIASNPVVAFLSGAVAGGIVGNAAYDALKEIVAHVRGKLRPVKRCSLAFSEIEELAGRVVVFFEKRKQARIAELCAALDAEPSKIEPVLMLLAFRCQRKGKRRIWLRPSSWDK
jgi:hypothetical protein